MSVNGVAQRVMASLMYLGSPLADGWQSSTFISYETPAATEGHPFGWMDSVWTGLQPRSYV